MTASPRSLRQSTQRLTAVARARSHAPSIALALAALGPIAGCGGSGGGPTPPSGPATTAPDAREAGLAPSLEGLDREMRRDNPLPAPALEITDDDIMEPLVGTPTLSETAID